MHEYTILHREGFGTIELANGDQYVGEWYQDQMHGKGKYIAADSEYEGQWVQGLRHGKVKCGSACCFCACPQDALRLPCVRQFQNIALSPCNVAKP